MTRLSYESPLPWLIELSHCVISVDQITTLAMSRLVQDRLGLFVKWMRKGFYRSVSECVYLLPLLPEVRLEPARGRVPEKQTRRTSESFI
ncbi:hypothetical protein NDU88_006673 [Pleurodeles waltl]|uniref:Uncharacterized protein n=1 Tax=Pleurodeles waltl TaxID=8319 RepID=A0AAV7SQL0_PLEWA|nr:hypothetical protein NDU88_006670 [Pleurodeles waltl]KAJ1166264.1 hypothetical protein NDU88_006672 [Pleurodeles waltl]KAJ1166265.1 hypothetical protein NDU88_006673 [Pleurodeles waltl]